MGFLEVEKAAARRSRGLETRASWAQIEAKAREIALLEARNPARFAGEFSPLSGAARALDDFAKWGVSGGPQAREAGLFAALAFAAGANFPSATVVIKRTFPVLEGRDEATAALLCLCAPTLLPKWKSAPFARVLREFLRGKVEANAVRAAWNETPKTIFSPDFWRLGQAALEAVLLHATHANLNPAHFPDGFLEALCPRVPTLLPPQRAALSGDFGAGGHALAALPPGTGKTLLGELFLARALGQSDGITVFVVPYVALGRGVSSAIQKHLPPGLRLQTLLGNAREENLELGGAQIWVATPERFDGILRAKPEIWRRLRGVVFDEAHVLGEKSRGARVEGLIARLKTKSSAPILLLSAAFDEVSNLANWLDATQIIQSKWTPTARRAALWKTSGRLEWHAELSDGTHALLGEKAHSLPHPLWYCGDEWGKKLKNEPFVWQNAAHLAKRLHDERGGAILCLCATRRATRQLGATLGNLWEATPARGARKRAIELIEARHRTLLPLAALLQKGIAWHNSSLPIEVRNALEEAVSEGEIAAIAATSTLAEGVDLPFAHTILCDWLRFEDGDDGKLAQKPMPLSLFRNIAGRCGRAGAFTEGETLVLENPLGPEIYTAPDARREWFNRALGGQNDGAPRSSWSENPGTRAAFESQILAFLAENETGKTDAFLAAQNGETWREQSEIWRANWERDGLLEGETLTARGRAFALLDASSGTLKTLLGALESLPEMTVETTTQAAKMNAYLWRALKNAPEVEGEVARFWNPRSRFLARPDDLESIVRGWLEGVAVEKMFALLPRAGKLEGLEKWLENEERGESEPLAPPLWIGEFDRFLDFLRAGLESWTPTLWRAAGVLAPLAGQNAQGVDWARWATRFENGVESDWAARAVKSGAVGGRVSANLVGRVWPFQSAQPLLDPLCLSPLRNPKARLDAENAIENAVQMAGGRWCYAGKSVLALRDWLWESAGVEVEVRKAA